MISRIFKLSSVLILVALLFSGCNKDNPVNNKDIKGGQKKFVEKIDLQAQDYAIYSILIDTMHMWEGVTSLVIFGQTTSYSLPYKTLDEALQRVNERMPGGIADEVLKDFLTKNKSPLVLKRRFDIGVPYNLLSKEESASIFRRGEDKGWGVWAEFERKHPNVRGIIRFSRVGFNSEMNEALVYTSTSRAGDYVLLTKKNSKWVIKHKHNAWVW